MTRFNGELFADAQFNNVLIQVKFEDGETQKDAMPLLLKKDFTYIFRFYFYFHNIVNILSI